VLQLSRLSFLPQICTIGRHLSSSISHGLLKLGSVAFHFRAASIKPILGTNTHTNTWIYIRETVQSFSRKCTLVRSAYNEFERPQKARSEFEMYFSFDLFLSLSLSLRSVIRSVGFACETPPRVTELGWQI